MASSREYLQFILERLSELEDITYRAMMGEFIIYYRGKIIGGIYDDRLLIKPVKSAISYMPAASYERPKMGRKRCCWLTKWIIRNFWQVYFGPCMMNFRLQKQKRKNSHIKGEIL